MKKHLLWLALLVFTTPQILKAQTIELVKDINTTGPGIELYMQEKAATSNLLFFLGYDVLYGNQIWRSDGTAEGTFRLTDIFNGKQADLVGLTATNGLAFWRFSYNNELWLFRSDGTVAGTFPLHKIPLGFPDTNAIVEINGTIYFPGSGTNGSRQLWKTDGTVSGTVLVKEISPDVPGATGAFDLFNFNGMLYFLSGVSNEGSESYRLWKSDGTAAGTMPGPAFGARFRPVALKGYMYFSENNALKRTDGTTVSSVKNFVTLYEPVLMGGAIYFFAWGNNAGTELWKSDGTAAGTVMVKDIKRVNNDSSSPPNLVNANGTLYFTADTESDSYHSIWKSNGTPAGTVQVKNLGPARKTGVEELIAVDNQAVLSVVIYDGNSFDQKLWKSDGTSAGTNIIANFRGNQLIGAGGTLYFNGGENLVPQLHTSNLTLAGTVALPAVEGPGSQPRQIFDCNGTGYFVAHQDHANAELWKTDNTTNGTKILKSFPPIPNFGDSELTHFTNVSGKLYFVRNDKEIWKSDGTPEGTVLVKDFMFQFNNYNDKISGLTGLNGTLFVGVMDVATFGLPRQLWKSDGTEAGTVLVTTFRNTISINPVVLKGQLYFLAWDGVNSYELWKSDGTAAGTSLVKNIASHSVAETVPVVANNYIYYILRDNQTNDKLLVKSDGTAAGTTVVKNLLPGEFLLVSDLFAAGNLVYFSLLDLQSNREQVWRTDGTAAGTIALGSVDTYTDPSDGSYTFLRHKVYAGGKFFFVSHDKKIGDQLWVSDGTPSGTRIVKQIGRFANDFTINQTAAVGNNVYFTPHDAATGTELWRSDGTSEGTYLVYDQTTNGSTAFYDLENVNGTLLISQGLDLTGAELYKYKPAPGVLRINSAGTAFTASAGRFFSADQYYSGSSQISLAASGDILSTADDQLYKEQRLGPGFHYSIPVNNGQMNVVLHFAELYWGVPGRGGSAGTGKRRFHVDMEGARKLANYDIFAAAGGAMRARTETFTVNVTDGILNINFLAGAADNPAIAAIEVLPAQLIVSPLADAYVRNVPNDRTNYGFTSTLEVKTGSLPSYQRGTYLKFPLTDVSQVGSAKLRLYGSNVQNNANTSVSVYAVSDDSWAETGITWTNAPVGTGSALGSVNVNSTARYYEIDVTAFVKSQLSGDKTVSFYVTNPADQNSRLIFNSRENAANRPQLVITTAPPSAARSSAEQHLLFSGPETETSEIYPNPAGKHFTVHISKAHQGKVDLQLIDLSGNTAHQLKAAPASKLDLNVSSMQLPNGIYIIKIQSAALIETVKLLLTE